MPPEAKGAWSGQSLPKQHLGRAQCCASTWTAQKAVHQQNWRKHPTDQTQLNCAALHPNIRKWLALLLVLCQVRLCICLFSKEKVLWSLKGITLPLPSGWKSLNGTRQFCCIQHDEYELPPDALALPAVAMTVHCSKTQPNKQAESTPTTTAANVQLKN